MVHRVLFPQILSPWQSGGELVMHFQIIWYCNYHVTNMEYLFRKNDVNCPMSYLCCKFPLPTFDLYVFIDVLWNLTLSCNELFIDCIYIGEWMWSRALDVRLKRMVLQCINGVSSNPVEGRTNIWQLQNLILTLV